MATAEEPECDYDSTEEAECEYECLVCIDTFPESKTVETECGHYYCKTCINKVFDNACSGQGVFPPKCCRPISLTVADTLLNEVTRNRTVERAKEWIEKSPVYCFEPFCASFIPGDTFQNNEGMCPKCHQKTCKFCKKMAHAGHPCLDDAADVAMVAMARLQGWKRCGKCHFFVEKLEGCEHMKCNCNYEFCYQCEKAWVDCNGGCHALALEEEIQALMDLVHQPRRPLRPDADLVEVLPEGRDSIPERRDFVHEPESCSHPQNEQEYVLGCNVNKCQDLGGCNRLYPWLMQCKKCSWISCDSCRTWRLENPQY